MKKILITGAGGFIGGHLARELSQDGYEIYGTYRRKMPIGDIYNAVYCDLSKDIDFDVEFDAVIHLASQIEIDKIGKYIDNTIYTMRNLISYCEKKRINQLIFASSISVYGECKDIVNENSSKVNLDNYAITKYISELLLRDSSIPSRVVLRLPRILGYGPEYSQPWLPLLTYRLMHNEAVNYFNPDLPYNNLCHVSELKDFIKILIDDPKPGFDIVGLGSGNMLKVHEIVTYLKEKLNSKSVLQEVKNTKPTTCFAIDITKAVNSGFKPKHTQNILDIFVEESYRYVSAGK